MKKITKPIQLIIALIAMFSFNTIFAGDYELNLRVTQNDNSVGGIMRVSLEARAVGSAITVGGEKGTKWRDRGGIVYKLGTNETAVNYSYGIINPIFASFVTQTITDDVAGIPGFISVQILSNSDAVSASIPTTWTEIAELTFTIQSLDDPLGFGINATSAFTDYTSGTITHNRLNAFDRVTYSGGSWSGGNGSSGGPAADGSDVCKALFIRDVVTLSAVTPTEYRVDYLDIKFGGQLTLGDNAGLYPWSRDAADHTVLGNSSIDNALVVAASATGYGQYKGPELPMEFQSYWGTDAGWRNMAFPATGISSLDIGATMNYDGGSSAICTPNASGTWGNYVNTTNLYEFTAGTPTTAGVPCAPPAAPVEHEWVGLTGTPAGGVNGYDVYWSPYFNPNGLVTVVGTSIESTSYNYTQSAPHAGGTGSQALQSALIQAGWDGWRIVANPFTCALDVSSWAADNGVGAASIEIFDRSLGTNVSAPATIAPGQAFWFKDGSNATLTFDVYDHGVVSSAPGLTKTATPGIALIMETGKEVSRARITFAEGASAAYDAGLDGYFRKDIHNANQPAVAFEVRNNHTLPTYLQSNAVSSPTASESMPVAVDVNKSGNVRFSSEIMNITSGVELAIEDLETAPGVLHNLVGESYTTFVTPGSGYGRFVIHMNAGKMASEKAGATMQLNAWFNGDILNLEDELANAQVQVYNLAGQVVAAGISSELISVTQTGVFVVQVVTEDGKELRAKVVKL